MHLRNSTEGSQITGGLLQHSESAAQKSPSWPSVHAVPQSLVHCRTPAAFARQQFVPQQSPSTVQPPPVPTQVVGLQTMRIRIASSPHAPLQQSALVVQSAPSTVQVPGLHTMPPAGFAGSTPHVPAQQSLGIVHVAPSGRQGGGGQQTSAPAASGAHTPQQQMSPNAHAWP